MGLFRKKHQPAPLPTEPVAYPPGIGAKTDKGWYLLNKDGKRYRFISLRAFDSWKYPLVVTTSEAALAKWPVAYTRLGYRDGTLLNNFADGRLYLVSEGKARHIINPEVMDRLGLNHSMATVISDAEFNLMRQGAPLN